MANNPYVNKVQTADGSTLMDITDTTAQTGDVLEGQVFYAASGQRSTGTLGDFTGATASSAGTHGLVPAPAVGDQGKYLRGDGTWAVVGTGGTVFVEYGYSTWDDFLAAYNHGDMIYCRAAEGTTPGVGELTRTAPMIGVNDEDSPTQVEFLYYKSDSTHSAAQQTDQVYVYKLNSYDLWSVSVRNVGTPVAAGTGIGVSYSNNTLTINNTAALPSAESTDEGKFLRVVNGVWAAATVPSAVGVNF